MKNALLLVGLWVGIIVFAYGVVYWDGGPPEVPYLRPLAVSETVYDDPGGLFRMGIPSGWRIEGTDPFVTIVAPDDELRVVALSVADEDPMAAIQAVWVIVDPAFALVPVATEELGRTAPIKGSVKVTYDPGNDDIAYAIANTLAGETIVLIVRGSSAAAERRRDEIGHIEALTLPVPGATLVEEADEQAEPSPIDL